MYVEDLTRPGSKPIKTKYRGNEQAMEGRARSLRAHFARTLGDGRRRVFIAPDLEHEPAALTGPSMGATDIHVPQRYWLWDDNGQYRGLATEEHAMDMVMKNDSWTCRPAIIYGQQQQQTDNKRSA